MRRDYRDSQKTSILTLKRPPINQNEVFITSTIVPVTIKIMFDVFKSIIMTVEPVSEHRRAQNLAAICHFYHILMILANI